MSLGHECTVLGRTAVHQWPPRLCRNQNLRRQKQTTLILTVQLTTPRGHVGWPAYVTLAILATWMPPCRLCQTGQHLHVFSTLCWLFWALCRRLLLTVLTLAADSTPHWCMTNNWFQTKSATMCETSHASRRLSMSFSQSALMAFFSVPSVRWRCWLGDV